MESRAEIERMKERQRQRHDVDAEKGGETILDLAIADDASGLGGRHLITFCRRDPSQPMPWHRFKAGSPVIVSPMREKGDGMPGVVSAVTRDSLQVAMDRFPDYRTIRIDATADEITRRRQLSAITHAMDAGGRLGKLRRILMGEAEPEFSSPPKVEFRTNLNESQQDAVRFALSAHDVAIIHGPPGTGKTTTVVELIIQAIERGDKVFACAPSNTAVDNLLERLIAGKQRVVRIGHPARVAEELQAYTLDGLVDSHESADVIHDMYRESEQLFAKADKYTRNKPDRGYKQDLRAEAKQLRRDAREMERRAIAHVLERADVICGTTAFNEDLISDHEFDLLVIDEACQSVEPGCWIPLARAETVVLAGDQCQLPPTVLSKEAAHEGFEISLLERVNNIYADQTTRLLTTQYRMHDEIMDFSSRDFYEGQLVADASVARHLLSDLPGVETSELTTEPVRYFDTAGAGWDEELEPDGLSKRNPHEAAFIVFTARQLLEAGIDARDIAIIAPYAAQVRMIRRLTRGDDELSNVEIGTVDGFQGREKEAVLISTVRSNLTGEVGFMADRRRMNVALTRARRKLIVIGDSATLGHHEFFRRLLDYFESIDAYGTVWETGFEMGG